MNTQQITSIIQKHFPTGVLESNIIINKYNNQIESLEIIFDEQFNPNLKLAGEILNDIDDLTIKDDYGDQVQASFSFDSYYESESIDQTVQFKFTFEIDS